jgi:succinylarginine dihydrolase
MERYVPIGPRKGVERAGESAGRVFPSYGCEIRILDLPHYRFGQWNMQIEVNLDGLVGPTHHFGGLGVGNLASHAHRGQVSNPQEAALQGLAKMSLVHSLGIPQFFLPPLRRPNLNWLSQVGWSGTPDEQLRQSWAHDPEMLSAAYSSAFMWMANAATVSPRFDSRDHRTHLTVANLSSNLHRSQEASERYIMLREMFAPVSDVEVHAPLPSSTALRDEGAANHMRLWAATDRPGVEIFVYGSDNPTSRSQFPSRQSLRSVQAIARLHQLDPEYTFFIEQHPEAIAAGVFHNDVIATSHQHLLLHHERAFINAEPELERIEQAFKKRTGAPLLRIVVGEDQLALNEAIKSYLFNSQIVTPAGSDGMTILCPKQCEEIPAANRLITSWLHDANNPIQDVRYVPLEQSMAGGGGPACLRLRVELSESQIASIPEGFRLTPERIDWLESWFRKYYPRQLTGQDLADPEMAKHALETIGVLYESMNLNIHLTELNRFK